MDTITLFGMPLGVVVLGLVEVAKRSGLPDRWCPAAAVVIGVVCGAIIALANGVNDGPGWLAAINTGLLAGLSAAGIFSGIRATLGK